MPSCDVPLARNEAGVNGIPVVIMAPASYPFTEGEEERDWHVASDAELQSYEAYFDTSCSRCGHDRGDVEDDRQHDWPDEPRTVAGAEMVAAGQPLEWVKAWEDASLGPAQCR